MFRPTASLWLKKKNKRLKAKAAKLEYDLYYRRWWFNAQMEEVLDEVEAGYPDHYIGCIYDYIDKEWADMPTPWIEDLVKDTVQKILDLEDCNDCVGDLEYCDDCVVPTD